MARRALGGLGIIVVVGMISASPALADHCGADATVEPPSGPPGTTFVFETNLGGATDLFLFRDEQLVESAFIQTDGPLTYPIGTGSGDAGLWRVRAELLSAADCAAETTFSVLGQPDTATTSGHDLQQSAPPLQLLLPLATGLMTFWYIVWRLSRTPV